MEYSVFLYLISYIHTRHFFNSIISSRSNKNSAANAGTNASKSSTALQPNNDRPVELVKRQNSQEIEKQREKERKKLAKAEETERLKQEKLLRANERKKIQEENMAIKKAQLENRQRRVQLESTKISYETNKHITNTTTTNENDEEEELRREIEMWSEVALGAIPKVKPAEGKRDTVLQSICCHRFKCRVAFAVYRRTT